MLTRTMTREDGSPYEERDGEDPVSWVVDTTGAPPAGTAPARACVVCRNAADFAHLNADGSFDAWYCAPCDYQRRRKRLGWRGRIKRRLRRALLR